MPAEQPIYDLVLLLSTGAPEERRATVLQEVESTISSSNGSIERNDDWGARGLAYQIAHNADAEYHLLQFRGPTELLESLSHNLRIADDVLRFRIIKVIPGTPPISDSPPPVVASAQPTPAASAPAAAAPAEVAPADAGGADAGGADAGGADAAPAARADVAAADGDSTGADPADASPAETAPADAAPAETAPPEVAQEDQEG
ncbi:MAG: 30S ribosomal protein S6 [Solirubrobacterales bacterium]|nr:30S ribosomal protein S6 [Solirubrobacterales bacterium]